MAFSIQADDAKPGDSGKPAVTPHVQSPATAPAQTPQEKADRLAIVARANALLARDNELSPAREYINFIRTGTRLEMLKVLSEPDPVMTQDRKWALSSIRNLVTLSEAGLTWPVPPKAGVPYASGPVVIDGNLDEPAWKDALTYVGSYPFNTRTMVDSPKTTWKLMWDEHCLYVGFECEDTDLEAKPAVRDDAVYGDDAVELFISPDIRFRSYWEIVTNINGVVFDSIECKHSTTWGPDLDPTQNVEGLKVATKLRGTVNDPSDKDQGYTVEMALPWTALLPQKSSRAQPGDQYGFMLCRIDRNASGTKAYSYQPLLGWGHNVWNMATMELLPKAR